MKTLDDLKNKKVIPFEKYSHNGNTVIYYPETMIRSKHYRLLGIEGAGYCRTKKAALKFLNDGIIY